MLPKFAKINNKQYEINTDFRVALACFRAIEDNEINDELRSIAVISLLFKEDVLLEDYEEAIKKAEIFLSCVKSKNNVNSLADTKKVMDYEYDRDLIFSSFLSEYGININTIENLHWWEFNSLIVGLSEKSALAKVINIREMDINEYKDPKTKAKIQKAKKKVELPSQKLKFNNVEKELLQKLGINYEMR